MELGGSFLDTTPFNEQQGPLFHKCEPSCSQFIDIAKQVRASLMPASPKQPLPPVCVVAVHSVNHEHRQQHFELAKQQMEQVNTEYVATSAHFFIYSHPLNFVWCFPHFDPNC
jgi:hypothetical protein